jgi:predicted adenine nucleotide alpha hydrolase (AANH) superfamily ATPase
MRILLHLCCAPCSTYTLKSFREEGHNLLGLFYNPNIHPFSEYLMRRRAMEEYSQPAGVPVIFPPEDEMESFFRQVASREQDRCRICYQMRLGRAAEAALAEHCHAFSTTLLISPYQKHELLREVGLEVASKTGVPFYYRDLRPGWKWSREQARQLGLYRQTYCGCLYSEKERQLEKRGRKGCSLASTPSASS